MTYMNRSETSKNVDKYVAGSDVNETPPTATTATSFYLTSDLNLSTIMSSDTSSYKYKITRRELRTMG